MVARLKAALWLVLAGSAAQPAFTQQTTRLDSLLAPHITTFSLAEGRLAGRGADVILEAARDAHFVVLGENHNTRAIPELTVALFQRLHDDYGFNYLALEEGPALGELLSRVVRSGAADGAFRTGLRFPNAFHMYTEEELRMIDRIGAMSTAKRNPIWGLNQEFGASHVLDRLVQIAPDAAARSAATAFLKRANEYENERFIQNLFFMSEVVKPADFAALRAQYRPPAGSEADRLIAQAELSNAVYAPYSTKPRPHFTSFHASGKRREENMKHLFAYYYHAERASGVETPKVLVKSGHVHTNRGIGPSNEVFSLGNFLSEVATFNGAHSLHLYVLLNWPDLNQSFLAPVVPHIQPNTNTVFDLRPIQPWAFRNQLGDLDPRLQRALTGYDFLIILNDMTAASVEALRTPRFRRYTGQ